MIKAVCCRHSLYPVAKLIDLYLASNIPGAFPKESAHDTATLPPANRPIGHEAGRAAPNTTESSSAAAPTGTKAHQTGTLGRILGAVGLGGAAAGTGIAASKAGEDKSQAVVDTPEQPTTTTGVGSYTAPTQSGPPPSHHRKESIPTTAYPAGPESPSPIHAPVGGTRAAPDDAERRTSAGIPSDGGATSYTVGGSTASEDKSHIGRNAGLAAAGVGAGAGAAALGSHEYDKSRGDPTTDTSTFSALPSTQSTTGSAIPSSGQTTSTYPTTTQSTTSSALPSTTGTGAQQGISRDQPVTSSGQDQQTSGYGKTAAATGLGAGAGAGAAGVAALQQERKPESTEQFADKPWQSSQTSSQPSTGGTSSLVREQAATQTPVTSAIGTTSTDPTKDDSHMGQNAALAGAAGAGAGAYGAHEYSKRQAEEGAARRQKDLAEQEAARQKQFEKDQKAAEKQAHKEEKQHEKDVKKQEKAAEKAHQKELKKEEKAHEKAVAKEEKQHQKELDKEEEAERKRREKEAAALAGTAGAGGATYAAHRHDDADADKGKLSSENDHERSKLHKDPPEQKKPGLFRRIFRRRKNKDTGDSEEYSTDEEDNTGTTGAATATAGVGAGAAGAGLAGSKSDTSYEAASGGQQKPSYNPLHKEDPSTTTGTTAGTTGTIHDATSSKASPALGKDGERDTRPIDDVTGLPYDPAKDPAAAERLAAHDTAGHHLLEKAEATAEKKEAGEEPLS